MRYHAIYGPFDREFIKGGSGSGNFGHAGRPGEIGGSAEGTGGGGGESQPKTEGTIQPRQWIEEKPGLPKFTQDKYKVGEQYVPERAKLHDEIVNKYTSAATPVPGDQAPQAILMMGGTASGKSSITKGLDTANFVKVDPDAIKEAIPEYREAVAANAKNAAFMVHEESGDVADRVREEAIRTRKNILVDGTGKNALKYQNTIKSLKLKGYHVTVIMPDLDVETAIGRASLRAEKTGRHVPEPAIRDIYSKAPKNFFPIASHADNAFLYDNRGKSPRLVWEKVGAVEKTHDEAFVNSFRRK